MHTWLQRKRNKAQLSSPKLSEYLCAEKEISTWCFICLHYYSIHMFLFIGLRESKTLDPNQDSDEGKVGSALDSMHFVILLI